MLDGLVAFELSYPVGQKKETFPVSLSLTRRERAGTVSLLGALGRAVVNAPLQLLHKYDTPPSPYCASACWPPPTEGVLFWTQVHEEAPGANLEQASLNPELLGFFPLVLPDAHQQDQFASRLGGPLLGGPRHRWYG